jgi:lipopolysaccharide transport system ATP-binding protein
MSKDIVIRTEGLGKKYVIGHQSNERYTALRDVLARSASNFFRGAGSMLRGQPIYAGDELEEFWALKDVSFEIGRGDVVGIIGRNGAGKSTLLKVLSRITEPTKGRIEIQGRVASLLEVGTGFHPELTGRENIYLNGAILGMTRGEIRRKFDEIVDFSGVEQFLDTPVKRYSSGMYVRLAFSVAAHLEPEILIVDEVLAVGDADFQKKCMGKMENVAAQGRTVIFVSHNMAMISNLTQNVILMNSGHVEFIGPVSEGVAKYYSPDAKRSGDIRRSTRGTHAELVNTEVCTRSGAWPITIHDEVVIRMNYRILEKLNGLLVPNFHFIAADGAYAFVSSPASIGAQTPGNYTADCQIPGNFLNEGAYFVGVAVTAYPYGKPYNVEFHERDAVIINVVDPMDKNSNRYGYSGPIPGVLRPTLEWNIASATW